MAEHLDSRNEALDSSSSTTKVGGVRVGVCLDIYTGTCTYMCVCLCVYTCMYEIAEVLCHRVFEVVCIFQILYFIPLY